MLELIIVPMTYVDPLSVVVSFSMGAVTAAAVSYLNNTKKKKIE